jgi:hypothetical protein
LLIRKAEELGIDIKPIQYAAKMQAGKEFAEQLKSQQPIPEKETIHQTNKQDKPHSGGGVGQGPKKKKSKK